MNGTEFEASRDTRQLQIFLAEMRQRVGQAAYFQFGDLMWRMHYWANRFDPSSDLRIWRDTDGSIDGFVIFIEAEDNAEFFVRPELYATRTADEMLSWATSRARASARTMIETSCIDGDHVKAVYLERHGFEHLDDALVFMERNLDSIPVWDLPPGYTFVSNTDRPDLPGVTGSSATAAQYAGLCSAPGYKDDLGLRVCHLEHAIVSGGICWYDDVDNCGELEPLGTVEEHRRNGLASAIICRTLENLRRNYGADSVFVRTDKGNEPAIRLYYKLGFRITAEDHGWRLAV